MSFLDDLLAGGPSYKMSTITDGASFRPSDESDEALEAFQSIVRRVRANEGDGYEVFQTHPCSDRPGNLIDLVLITFEDV